MDDFALYPSKFKLEMSNLPVSTSEVGMSYYNEFYCDIVDKRNKKKSIPE